MDNTELRHYGYFLAEMVAALDAKMGTGIGVTPTEKDAFYVTPKVGLATLYRKAMSNQVITEEVDLRLTCIMDGIKAEDAAGTPGNPLGLEKQGTIMIAYYHWTSNLEAGGEMLDAAKAAEIMGVSVQYVYKLIDDGKLDGVKYGKKWRVCHRSVNVRKEILAESK